MDPITQSLLHLGIGGLMAACVVWSAWYQTTKTIPNLMEHSASDRAIMREQFLQSIKEESEHHTQERATTRSEFRNTLKEQQDTFLTTLTSIANRMEQVQHSLTAIIPRLEAMDRHTVANEGQLQILRDIIHTHLGKTQAKTRRP